jgi:hypothetical protein
LSAISRVSLRRGESRRFRVEGESLVAANMAASRGRRKTFRRHL